MNLRLRSFLFRLPLFFFRTNRKRAEKKHIFCPACFYFFLPSTSYVYITSQEPALYGMHFCIASKQKFPTLIPIPFSAGIDMVGYILNIILFIPFGFLIPLIWKKMRSLHLTALAGFSFSILIEISQLLNNRRTDIDDLIMNTLGAIIGFLIYKSFKKLMPTRLHNKLNDFSYPVLELPLYIFILFAGRFFFFHEMGFAKLLYGF